MAVKLLPTLDKPQIGESKLGGLPDLPDSIAIPQSHIRPYDVDSNLAFICQLNLADFKNDLAPSGMLYFFATVYPDCVEGAQAIYYQGDEPLYPRQHEITQYVSWRETPLYDCQYPLPEYGFRFEELPEPSASVWDECLDDNNEPTVYTGSKFMGSAYTIQPPYLNSYIDEPYEEKDYRLLLQLAAEDFEDVFEYVCSDYGYIYFALPEKISLDQINNARAWMSYD